MVNNPNIQKNYTEHIGYFLKLSSMKFLTLPRNFTPLYIHPFKTFVQSAILWPKYIYGDIMKRELIFNLS